MTEREREIVLQFMRLVMDKLHPNLHEYPLIEMASAEGKKGDEFVGTEFEGIDYLTNGYYMWRCVNAMERQK
jgi:hypothetical protein